METIKLTVAIPTYDREVFLRQALESLQNQTEQSFKVILFDNASTYNINALISQFPSLSISLERNTINMGNQANFERVMAYQFNTPYVMIFHDDDTIHPNYFEDAFSILNTNEKTQWVGSFVKYVHSATKMMEFEVLPLTVPKNHYNRHELADAFMNNLPIGFSPVIYRASALAGTKAFTTKFYKWFDRPLMLDAVNDGQATVFHFPYINYRIHPSQDSAQKYKEHIPAIVNLTSYISSAGSTSIGRKYAATNALRTAVQNADSVKEFKSILTRFKKHNLYRIVDISPYSIYWFLRILLKRTSNAILSKTLQESRIDSVITIHTYSQSFVSKEYWKRVLRQLISKYSGPDAVRDSLVRGLQGVGVKSVLNPKKQSEVAVVLSGTKSLEHIVKSKRSGLVKTLIAGPNIVASPLDEPLLLSNEIDCVLVPSIWVKDLWVNLCPKIENKIKVWPSGVEIQEPSTRSGLPIIYDKLKDEALLKAVKNAVGNCQVFTYGKFKRQDYINALKDAPYVVYLSKSESQGLALQEAWAHDVPTIVNRSTFWQSGELSWEAPQINCPYLTPATGEVFDNPADIPIMIERITSLHPKTYCDKELSDQASAEKLLNIIENTHVQNS